MNDRFGHLEGNRVLQLVRIKASCREYDYVARMGGDEFVLIIPGIDPEDVAGKIAHFRSVVRDVGLDLFNSPLTISVGAANFPADGNDAEQLLAEADRRMYKEKRAQKTIPTLQPPNWKTDWLTTVH